MRFGLQTGPRRAGTSERVGSPRWSLSCEQPRPVQHSPGHYSVFVLAKRDEWEALQQSDLAEGREELRHRLTQVRERVAEAGLDPATVDEAIEAIRTVP